MRLLLMLIALAMLFVMAGCQSKNPMEYMPASGGGYAGINFEMVEKSEGLMRLDEALTARYGGSTIWDSDNLQRVYVGFSSIGPKNPVKVTGVVYGAPGLTTDMANDLKAGGATVSEVSGRDVYTSDTMYFSPVGTTGMLFYYEPEMLDKMIAVSKGKEATARATNEFSYVDSNLGNNAAVVAIKASLVLDDIKPETFQQLERASKPGTDALREVSMISAKFNWEEQPTAEVILHLEDDAKAKAAADLLNLLLTGIKQAPSSQVEAQILPNVTIGTNTYGVSIEGEIPAAMMEELVLGGEAVLPQSM